MQSRALLLALLLALPSLAPTVGAESHDAALRAAVAPVQVVLDAGADLIHRAIDESVRDGTPDQARFRLAQIQSFVKGLTENLSVSENATYRDATLAAAPHADSLATVLAEVPENVALVSRLSERCTHQTLTAGEHEALSRARAAAEAVAIEISAHAAAVPSPLDATRLDAAGIRLLKWTRSHEKLVACLSESDLVTQPFLRVTLSPSRTWPTGEVRVSGVTNAASEASLEVPGLGISQRLPVVEGRFSSVFMVPQAAPRGIALVSVAAGTLREERNLTVEPAPSNLQVFGPSRAQVGQDVAFAVRLSSPVPAMTTSATVLVTGAVEEELYLANGTATLRLRAPAEPADLVLTFRFAGGPIVAGDVETVRLLVGLAREPEALPENAEETPPAPSNQAGETPPAPSNQAGETPLDRFAPPSRMTLLVGLVVALVLAGTAFTARQVLSRRAPIPSGRAASVGRAEPGHGTIHDDAEPSTLGLVPLFVLLARRLRGLGLIMPSTTAREMRPLLSRFGIDASRAVEDFERVRYGSAPETPAVTERSRSWFRATWDRVRGARP